jgi:DNA ligase-associated metallophosphoesterase
MDVDLLGIQFQLHSSGAAYWQAAKSLLLADLHLGKESVFQQAGIAIPSGASAATLEALRLLVEEFAPERVIVLGDLLHAKVGLTPRLEQELTAMLREQAGRKWILIPGNHDRGGIQALRRCGWCIADSRIQLDGVEMNHAPELPGGRGLLSISGHLHPSIRISLSAKEKTSLRCFWLHATQFILPAFGGWTGTQPIVPERGDRVFACVEREVIELAL